MSDFRAQDSLTSSTTTFAVTPGPLTVQPPLPTPPDAPVVNKLLIFQTAVGIPISAQNPYSIYKKNRGIYLSVIHNERYSRWSYHIFEIVINVCLMLQILLAAALTALGASSAKHTIITAFGSANTILAGTVALLKGQGLPNRLRQDWNTWRDLRDCIEEKEREIGCGKPGVDVWAEIKIIEDKYDSVKQNQEKNRPDSYTHIDRGEHIELEDGNMMNSRKGKGKASF